MSCPSFLALAVATALLLVPPDASSAPALTLDDALAVAQGRSGTLQAKALAAGAARDMAVAAGQRPDPVLKLGITNLPIDGPDAFSIGRDFMTMRSVGVMQEVTRTDTLKARAARYEREADAAGIEGEMALADLQRRAATAWLECHFRTQMRDTLRTLRGEAALQVEASEAAWRGGRGAQGELFAARAELARIDDRLAQAQQELASATIQLSRWIGEASAVPLAPPPALDRLAEPVDEDADHLARHPEIALLQAQELQSRAEADLARRARNPDPTVELMFSQRGPGYSRMVSLGVSLPLPWDGAHRQDREVAARLAQAEQRRAEREELLREHLAEQQAARREWQADRDRLDRYAHELQPLAAERTRAALSAYRGNTGPLSAVLEARRAELETRMDQWRLELDAARLWAQLNFLVPRHDLLKRAELP